MRLSLPVYFLLQCLLGLQSAYAAEEPHNNNPGFTSVQQEVFNTEMAFAKTMADRDLEAFASFIAQDAIFMANKSSAHGREAIVKRWSKHFEKPQASFAWKPERVEVLENGSLALSTGPVWDEEGQFSIFTSIWRKNEDGNWKVIFDKGNKYCP